MRRPQPQTYATIAASVAIVAAAAFGLVIGAPSSIAVQATRVIATPAPKAAVTLETPRPIAAYAPGGGSYAPADECPQMDNPGGHMSWIPSANAGPWATDGTVSVPALGTSAPIVRVGVDRTGQMVVPPGARQVAWLDQGGVFGQTNNLVLAGHISWAGVPGAFERIGDLSSGDTIVLALDGKRMTFRVRWVCAFARTSSRAAQIMGYTTTPSLTLITCGGTWDSYAGTHNERIAARADLIDEEPA
jgi:sortase (surface protein transpeptidase)